MHFKKKYKIILFTVLFISLLGSRYKQNAIEETTSDNTSKSTNRIENIKTTNDTSKFKNSVNGKDEDGNLVQGKVMIEGKRGLGILTNNHGEKIEIVFEMITHSKIIATDIEGIKYKLKIK